MHDPLLNDFNEDSLLSHSQFLIAVITCQSKYYYPASNILLFKQSKETNRYLNGDSVQISMVNPLSAASSVINCNGPGLLGFPL